MKRSLRFEQFEERRLMAGECLPTGPVVAALTACRNWVTYSPSQPYNPDINVQPTDLQIKADLQQLFQEGYRGLVMYTLDGPFANVPQFAKEIGFMKVIAGLYWNDTAQLNRELATINNVNLYADAYVVGNEGLGYNGQSVRYSAADLLTQINALRDRTGKPVTTTETFPNYQANPSVVAAGDWLFPNSQPWFNGSLNPTNISGMVQTVVGEVNSLQQLAGNRVVVLKEAWWPTSGPAGASEANQVTFYQQLAAEPVFFVFGEAYDQPWKNETSPFGNVGPSWGLHRADRTPKAIVSQLADVYRAPYFATRDMLPGALAFLQQMTLPNGLPMNEATAAELATLTDTNNSVATHNRFFNPAQVGFWLTTSVLSHALRQRDATFTAGMTEATLVTELTATIEKLEAIAITNGSVYQTPAGQTPKGMAFYHNYDSDSGLPRTGPGDREVPFIDNGYLAVGLLSTAGYLRRAANQTGVTASAAFLDLARRADSLAKQIHFAIWFDAASKRFHLGGTDNPQAGGFVDRITSESRLVLVLALALGQISRTDFDAASSQLLRESRSGSRVDGAPPVERLPVFGTALEMFVPTIYLSTELETLFGQSTLAQGALAALNTAKAIGLPAAGAMGVANGGTPPNGANAKYLNFGLSPAEINGDANNPRDKQVLIPPAAAIIAGTIGKSANPQLQAVGVAANRNLATTIQQLRSAGKLDPKHGSPNYLDFGSNLVNSTNPVRGFLEQAQMAVALLNEELGGGYLENILRQYIGFRAALDAYLQSLNVRELEFSPSGVGTRLIRSQASGGFNLASPADTDGGVWHLQNAGDSATYSLSVGRAGIYQAKIHYSNDDTGTLDNVRVAVDGLPVANFTTADTNDWNQFTETAMLPLGELLPGTFQLTITLTSTDGFGIDLDTLSLTSSPRNWHNERNARDVDGNTFVTPLDALIVINELNRTSSRQFTSPPPADATLRYFDVDSDGYLAPLDVLIVINYLNQLQAQGEGEGEAKGEGEGWDTAMTFIRAFLTDPISSVWPSSSWGTGATTTVPFTPSPNRLVFVTVAVKPIQSIQSIFALRSDRTPSDNELVDSLVLELFANDEWLDDDVGADVDTL